LEIKIGSSQWQLCNKSNVLLGCFVFGLLTKDKDNECYKIFYTDQSLNGFYFHFQPRVQKKQRKQTNKLKTKQTKTSTQWWMV
jgi:hypothetical protein